MLRFGPWLASIPCPRASAPSTWPYCVAIEVSKVAPIPSGAGRRDTPVSPKAIPHGPSDMVREGMQSRATPSLTFS